MRYKLRDNAPDNTKLLYLKTPIFTKVSQLITADCNYIKLFYFLLLLYLNFVCLQYGIHLHSNSGFPRQFFQLQSQIFPRNRPVQE